MATAAQITANRLNAQHSTGPRTPEGKARSSQNALKSGYCSTRLVIAPERQADFDVYAEELLAHTAPEGPIEMEYFQRVLVHGWNLKRIRDDETRLAESERNEANSQQLALLSRYRRSLERSYDRAIKALRELQTERLNRRRYPKGAMQELAVEYPLADVTVLPDPAKIAEQQMWQNVMHFCAPPPRTLPNGAVTSRTASRPAARRMPPHSA